MPSSHADGRSTFDGGGWSKGQGAKGSANQHPRTDGPEPQDRSVLRCPHRFCCAPTGSSNKGRFLLRCMSPLMALDDLRCNAQISVGIGAISDIKGGLRGLKSGAYDPNRTLGTTPPGRCRQARSSVPMLTRSRMRWPKLWPAPIRWPRRYLEVGGGGLRESSKVSKMVNSRKPAS